MVLTTRNLIAFFLAVFLMLSGKVRKARERAMKGEFIISIYFHNPSKKEFESIVKWLIKKKFHFISLYELKKIVAKDAPFPKGAVLITVDDGWASNENNIVETANKYRVPVTIFVATEPVEIGGGYWWSYGKAAIGKGLIEQSIGELKKMPNQDRLAVINGIKDSISLPREAMTIDQIKRISRSDLVTLGGHSHSHAILTTCTDKEMDVELAHSKEKLTSWIGKEVECFAYPNGDFSQREIEVVKKFGYTLGFGNNARYLTREELNKNYSLPRFGFLEGASFVENICRMVGVWSGRRSIFKKRD